MLPPLVKGDRGGFRSIRGIFSIPIISPISNSNPPQIVQLKSAYTFANHWNLISQRSGISLHTPSFDFSGAG